MRTAEPVTVALFHVFTLEKWTSLWPEKWLCLWSISLHYITLLQLPVFPVCYKNLVYWWCQTYLLEAEKPIFWCLLVCKWCAWWRDETANCQWCALCRC